MEFSFAHSLDRETFDGTDSTRQDALRNALRKAAQLDTPPDTVYVGKRVPLDPGSSGLAEMILGAMRRRVREATGENSNQYLMRVNEHQLAELDTEIDRVIRDWLSKNELTPAQSKIIAISEHPVPQPSMHSTGKKNANGEVSDLGVSESPITLW